MKVRLTPVADRVKGSKNMRYSMLVFVAIFAVAGAAFVQAQPKGGGAPLDLVGDLVSKNHTAGKTKILAAADEMPEAGYGFQPVPEERNFGQWVAHVADLQAQFCGGITGDTKQLGAAAKTTKADLVAALKASFDMCDAAYDGTTAANGNDNVQTFRGPRPRVSWLVVQRRPQRRVLRQHGGVPALAEAGAAFQSGSRRRRR